MGKIWIEVCLISARGLRRSSLWKLQWFAVGWIDPNNKYCTRIDASGGANPVWKTKFATSIDESKLQDMALHVEVYNREPIFLRESLQGTAVVVLKEFLAKHGKDSEASRPPIEEVGSYQLRTRNSNKPKGFVDVSIRISEEREEPNLYADNGGGFVMMDYNSNITLSTDDRSGQALPRLENQSQTNFPFSRPVPYPGNHTIQAISGPHPGSHSILAISGPSYSSAPGPSYQPPRTPPPPPPPANVGYIPTFLPRTEHPSATFVNMPSAAAGPRGGLRPGFGMGMGAGALAAGAVIFGDDFMSGFDVPAGLQDASLTISTDPPF